MRIRTLVCEKKTLGAKYCTKSYYIPSMNYVALRNSVFLSPEGTLQSREPKEVQLFLLMFYPPKGLCKADTEGGPIVFTYVLFCVRKRILDFQFTGGFLPF